MAAEKKRDYKTITEIRELREETLKKIGSRIGMGDYEGAELHILCFESSDYISHSGMRKHRMHFVRLGEAPDQTE